MLDPLTAVQAVALALAMWWAWQAKTAVVEMANTVTAKVSGVAAYPVNGVMSWAEYGVFLTTRVIAMFSPAHPSQVSNRHQPTMNYNQSDQFFNSTEWCYNHTFGPNNHSDIEPNFTFWHNYSKSSSEWFYCAGASARETMEETWYNNKYSNPVVFVGFVLYVVVTVTALYYAIPFFRTFWDQFVANARHLFSMATIGSAPEHAKAAYAEPPFFSSCLYVSVRTVRVIISDPLAALREPSGCSLHQDR